MKTNRTTYHKYKTIIPVLGLLAFTLFFSACKKDDSNAGPITISTVYLEDASSSVPDREVSFVRLGQLIRIEGSGFNGLREVYINGYSTYFNPVYVSDNSMLITVSSETPIVEADSSDRNTIRFVNDKYETTFDFDIRSAAPTITSISHTLPQAGETITVYGSSLIEVTKVTFPGDIEVTSGITSNDEGEYFTVVVPDNVSEEGGSLFVECANGGAYSPAYFGFKNGVILDFDGNGTHGYWGSATSMITSDDLESASIGTDNVSQGIYVPHHPERIDTLSVGNRLSEVWTAGNTVDDWRGDLIDYIPATTSVDEVAFQFDIYVPDEWTGTGFLKICLYNGFNGGEWQGACYNYVPWIQDGEAVPFQTEGWVTVTVPFSEFYAFSDDDEDYTFEDVLSARESSNYRNFGIYFENSDINLEDITGDSNDSETEFAASETMINVYTDNWRVVSLETPTYSDYSDD